MTAPVSVATPPATEPVPDVSASLKVPVVIVSFAPSLGLVDCAEAIVPFAAKSMLPSSPKTRFVPVPVVIASRPGPPSPNSTDETPGSAPTRPAVPWPRRTTSCSGRS